MTLRPVIVEVTGRAAARTAAQVAAQRAAARAALLESAALSRAPRDGWMQDAAGAPLVNNGWHWSVAHTRRYAVGVVSRHPVGVDIEALAPRRETLWEALADGSEWTLLGGRSWPGFFRLWTAKEAVVKSAGLGLGVLGECRLAHGGKTDRMAVCFRGETHPVDHYAFDGHLAAVTADSQQVEWCVRSHTGAASRAPIHDRPFITAGRSGLP